MTWIATTVLMFLVITGCSNERPEPKQAPATNEKRQIRDFWEAYRKANPLRLSGDFEGAVAGYRAALAIDPEHEESLYYLGVSLEEIGDYPNADAAYEQLLSINPNSGRALTQLASLLSTPAPGGVLDYDRAQELIRRAIKLNREQAGPFLLQGYGFINQGHYRESAESFAVAARFGTPEGNAWTAAALYLDGQPEQAAPYVERVLAIYRREHQLTGAGISSEGDVLPARDKPLGSLERAGLIAMFLERRLRGQQGWDQPPPVVAAELNAPVQVDTVARVTVDFNGDSRPDLFELPWRKQAALKLGTEDGGYRDFTEEAGLSGIRADGHSAVSLDYDRDGWPDLLVTSHAAFEDSIRCLLDPDFRAERSTPRLFRNRGDGTFEETTETTGLRRSYGTLRAVPMDADTDGWKDVLLINGSLGSAQLEPSVLLRNVNGKEFVEAGRYAPTSRGPRY